MHFAVFVHNINFTSGRSHHFTIHVADHHLEIAFAHAVHRGTIELRRSTDKRGSRVETFDMESNRVIRPARRATEKITLLYDEHVQTPLGQTVRKRAATESAADDDNVIPSPRFRSLHRHLTCFGIHNTVTRALSQRPLC